MRKVLYVSFCFALGCSHHMAARSTVPSSEAVVAPPVSVPAVEVLPATAEPSLAQPQVRKEKGIVRYPYGEPVTVRCRTLRACDIELQEGEVITQTWLGDSKRWFAMPSVSGRKDKQTPHVMVKPTETGISTNLIIHSDRRTYQIELVEGGKGERVGFWYPDEEAAQRAKKPHVEIQPQPIVNERYSIKGSFPWRPSRIYDDNVRTIIELPSEAHLSELPVLFVTRNGRDELVNYSVQDGKIVIGQLIDKAAFVLGVGWGKQRLEIVREQ